MHPIHRHALALAGVLLALGMPLGAQTYKVLVTYETNNPLVSDYDPYMDDLAYSFLGWPLPDEDSDEGRVFEFNVFSRATLFIEALSSATRIPNQPTTWQSAVAEVDHIYSGTLTTNDPEFPNQYALVNTNWQQGYDLITSLGPLPGNVVIASLDSGITYHPDLSGVIIPGFNASEMFGSTDDLANHGTGVAGIMVAGTNNFTAIAGVSPNALVMPVKVSIADTLFVETHTLAKGINWARKNDADVISMTFEVPPSKQLFNRVEGALEEDIVMIASAGNFGTSDKRYPGAYAGVMAVAASDATDNRAVFSSYGDWVSMAAPGDDIVTLTNDIGTHYQDGTSYAAAHVAGTAAMLRGMCPLLREHDIRQIIRSHANPVPGSYVTHGLLDIGSTIASQFAGGALSCQAPTGAPGPDQYPYELKGNPAFAAGWADQNGASISLPTEDPAVLGLLQSGNDGQFFALGSVLYNGVQEGRLSMKFVVPSPPAGMDYDYIRLILRLRCDSADLADRRVEVRPKDWDDDQWGNDDLDTLVSGAAFTNKTFEFNDDLDDLVRDDGVVKLRVRVLPKFPTSNASAAVMQIDRARVEVGFQ